MILMAGDGGVHLVRGTNLLGEAAVDAIADAKRGLARLDVDVAGAFLDGVVDDVVHQLDDGRITGGGLQVDHVLDGLLDDVEFLRLDLLDDVVDDKDLVGGEIGLERALDVARRGRDHLHLIPAEPLDLFQEKDVGRFRHGDRQHALDQIEGQSLMLLEKLLGKHLDDFGIGNLRADARVWNRVGLRQRFDDLVFGADS